MFKSILNLCETNGYIKTLVNPEFKNFQLKVTSIGCFLLHNLKNEWYNNVVINKDTTVFVSHTDSFQDTFTLAKNMCSDKLPFAIAEILSNQVIETEDCIDNKNEESIDFRKLFNRNDRTILKCTVFNTSQNSRQYFYQWLKQRRMWWRKFSPNPGRYSTTDIKQNEDNVQSVEILAEYSWISQPIEKIVLYPFSTIVDKDMKIKEGRKLSQLHTIVSEVDTSTMFINTLCDAYDDSEYKGDQRIMMRLHRKLAPYLLSICLTASSATVLSELNDLGLYIARQLRSKNIPTLFLPSSLKQNLAMQWKQFDELGIPYVLLLNEKTLKDGIAALRNRDTTLKEQVHVADLVNYVEKLYENY